MKLFILIILFIIPLFANNVEVVESKYLLDAKDSYDIENIYNHKDKFSNFSYSDSTFGFRDDTLWIYIKVKNITTKKASNVIEFLYRLHDYIYVLEYKDGKIIDKYLTGDLTKHNTRKIDSNSLLIPYNIDANETKEFIFKINSKSNLSVGMQFSSKEDFLINSKYSEMIYAAYYGATLIMLLYNLFLYFIIKERVYLLYVLFHFFFLLLQFTSNGFSFTFLWPNMPQINNYFLPLAFILTSYFMILFTLSFLELKRYSKKLYFFLRIILLIDILFFFSTFFVGYSILENMINLGLITITLIFFSGVYVMLKYKTASSKFFVLAWSFSIIGIMLELLVGLGVLETNPLFSYASQIGSFAELILLSIALAYRYNTLFLQLSHTQENLRVLNKTLEQKVLERTKDLENKQEQLLHLNNNLETKIQKAIKETKSKEKMLQQQSKLASMGEMINNIAHQWRQPLAVSNTIVSILKEKNQRNSLNKDYAEKKLNEIESNNLYMSQTIEDFLSFFNPKKKKKYFHVNIAVDKAINIIYNLLEKNQIKINVNISNDLKVYGLRDEYIQVIISIVSNAIYALDKCKSKQINIIGYKIEDNAILEIYDNAGGIPSDIIDRVFEPYFTTKHKTKGTGLGLYISKMIIENSMNGTLFVKNIDNGTKFIISCKNSMEDRDE